MIVNQRIKWDKIAVVNDVPMDGEEIVKEIFTQSGVEITRQNISNALKNAMGNFFHSLLESDEKLTPFQTAVEMLKMLYLPHGDFRGGIDSFFRLFPSDVRKIIENDARLNYMRNMDIDQPDTTTILCKNCFHCKISKSKGVYCDKGYFKDKRMSDIELFMPYDFECKSFDEMY